MNSSAEKQVLAVIGGGITGLSAAYYAEKMAREIGLPLQIVLTEAQDRLGGKIQTVLKDGFVIEAGPDSFLARKPAAVNLIRELGMAGELVGTNPANRKTYILHQAKLHRIPAGLNIGVPTQFLPFVSTDLLSWQGKLRAGLDLVLPPGPDGDQSIGELLERRLGTEVVDHLAEPLLAGIYAGDLRQLSVRATFPQFQELEQKSGSLIRGMWKQAQAAKAAQSAAGNRQPAGQAGEALPQSVFLTFRKGLEQLVGGISGALAATEIRLQTKVAALDKMDGQYRLTLDSGQRESADAVIVTTPTYQAASFLPQDFSGKPVLESVPYISTATVVLAFRAEDIKLKLDGSGFVVPRTEKRTISACTWVSSKWQHTAPDGYVLVRCYVGRAGDQEVVFQSDEEILVRVRRDIAEIMNLTADPLFTLITRFKEAMPQYFVGHLERLEKFNQEIAAAYPGLFFGGAGFTGVGIPDCIDQGKRMAEEAIASIRNRFATEAAGSGVR